MWLAAVQLAGTGTASQLRRVVKAGDQVVGGCGGGLAGGAPHTEAEIVGHAHRAVDMALEHVETAAAGQGLPVDSGTEPEDLAGPVIAESANVAAPAVGFGAGTPAAIVDIAAEATA